MFTTKLQIAGSALKAHARLDSQNKVAEAVKAALSSYDKSAEGEMVSIIVAEVEGETGGETCVWIKPYAVKFEEVEKIVVGGLIPIDADGSRQHTGAGSLQACVYIYDIDDKTIDGGSRPKGNWLPHVLDKIRKDIESVLI